MHASFNTLIEQYPLPIAAQLRCWAARYSTQTALVDDGGALTYSELDVRVDQLAAGLDSLGLRSGQHVIVQLPNGNAFVILLFALLRLGAIPVLAMPSQRELDIDALIALAQPVAYFIHGENHAGLARQMMHKHACLRHVLTIEQCADDEFTPLFCCAASFRRGGSPRFPPPRCCCFQAAPPGRQSLFRDGTPTIAITSAPLPNCAASTPKAYISPSFPWRIIFRWPVPVFWERLPAAGRWC